ncbi:MAG: LamG domain-containing protein [Bacteroidales bacterium]|nr:LamG domain-containing protein [Bacteroidales bacterium]
MSLLCIIAAAATFALTFENGTVPGRSEYCQSVPGIEGQAAFFDGFDSRIIVPAAEVKAPERYFTVDVWVCPVAFPKSPCPVASRQRGDGEPGGWSLWMDALGKVHFSVASAGEWVQAESPEGLPLREWSRLTAFFRPGSGLFLAIDGREVAKQPLELPGLEQADYDLWIGRTPFKTPSFYENKSIPIYSSFDGLIDELKFYDDKNAYKGILKEKFARPAAPELEARVLPSGPDSLAFGAWYIPLKFYKAFDERWRGSLDDVVVGFGPEQPWKVVFWKGISYAPCFVTEKGNWMCNEFIERKKVTGWGCPESMSDKHADFSSVRIVENTPARTVVVWRNLPVGVNQKIPYQSEESGWGDCSEETYIFYPDGVGVRKMEVWSSHLDEWYEWCQSLQVLHPSQRPEDVLDASRIMSVAAMDGRSETFGWDFDDKARQDGASISGANIQVTYLKSQWNPYLILEDGDGINEKGEAGPRIDRYVGRWSEFSDFPWRNHWPVTQDYIIGRYACVPDAPAHTYTATQYNAPHSVEGNMMTKLMLCGCTEGDAADLLPLAKSWLRAPRMTLAGSEVPYDVTQRAYVIPSEARESPSPKEIHSASGLGMTGLTLRLEASSEHPVRGLCLILKGMPSPAGPCPAAAAGGPHPGPAVKVDGKALEGVKAGVHRAWDGESLILWLPVEADHPVEISF